MTPRASRVALLAVALLAAWVLVSACGDDADTDAAVADGSRDAATLEPCLRTTRLDMTPIDPRSCGICVEPHVRVAMPYWYGGVYELEAHAVPGGVVLSMGGPGTLLVFVTTDGDVIPLHDVPEVQPRPEGYRILGTSVRPVPDRQELWLVQNLVPIVGRTDNAGELFYYRFGPDGWTEVAADSAPASIHASTALPSGELVGLAGVRPSVYLGMIRARTAGSTVDRLIAVPDFGGAWPPQLTWPLETGETAVLLEHHVMTSARDRGFAVETWLGVVDAELELLREPVRVSLPADQWGFDRYPGLVQVALRRSGQASLLFAGTADGMDAALGAHLWLNRITPAGELQFGPPGMFVNPDDFMLRSEARDPSPDALPEVSGSIVVLPSNRSGVFWYEYPGGDHRNHGQVVAPDGSLMLPGGELRPSGALGATVGTVVADGSDHVFVGTVPPENTNPDPPVGYALVDENMGVSPFILPQECPRLRRSGGAIAGAYDEGAWVAWMDVVQDPSGGEAGIVKVMLVRPDGSYAWGAEQ